MAIVSASPTIASIIARLQLRGRSNVKFGEREEESG